MSDRHEPAATAGPRDRRDATVSEESPAGVTGAPRRKVAPGELPEVIAGARDASAGEGVVPGSVASTAPIETVRSDGTDPGTELSPARVAHDSREQGVALRLDAETLVALVAGIVGELRGAGEGPVRVGLDTDLGGDLGLDSLARMELLARVERAAGASLPEVALAEATTPRELLRAFESVRAPAPGPGPDPVPGSAEDLPRGGQVAGEDGAAQGAESESESDAVPAEAETLIDALAWHAGTHPDRTHVRLVDGSDSETVLTFGALLDGARRVASGLLRARLTPGRAVAIMLPTGFDYLRCFLGVQLAGGVPVPIYPPARLAQLEDHLRRHERILDNADAEWLVTFDEARRVSRLLAARSDGGCRVATVGELAQIGGSGREPELLPPGPDDIAFLQYTSGSTGQPKGVVLTHRNVLASLGSMAEALSATPRDVFVSWLPLYHDLGLIAAWLGSLVYGFPLVLMSPLAFLARPARWLQAIHRHRGTLSGGPNFAFDLCTRRIADDEIGDLDLSSWRMAFNGAEPVLIDTLTAFGERFAAFGLDPRALAPVYGLAEATLGVAFTPVGRGPLVERVARNALERERRAEPADPDDATALRCISSGVPIPGFEVRTVDDGGRETPERVEGRLQFQGPSTTSGYFRDRAATAALFDGDWLESGDLAYVAGGEVFITGRVKDVVIRAGRNLYPYDFEQAAGDIEGVRRGCVALFSAHAPQGTSAAGTERLVVVAETRESAPERRAEIRAALEDLSGERLGQPMDEVVLAPPHTVLKTSSGKIRRRAMAELYESGELGGARAASRPLWLRLARLAAGGTGPALRRAAHRVRQVAFAGWIWAAIGFAGVIPGLAVIAARQPRFGYASVRAAALAIFRLSRIRVTVDGAEHLDRGGPFVIVSNHTSYADGLALMAALRRPFRFVAKAELRSNLYARWFLDGIGALYVDRFDVTRSVAHAGGLTGALRAGESILIFAEGTLHRMPGLMRFQTGGFMAAVEAEAPVVPVVLRGTRSFMRNETWLPRRVPIHVRIGPPIPPPGAGMPPSDDATGQDRSDWSRAVELRDAVRAWMLAHCGEPDLANRNPLRDLIERRTGPGT